MKRLLVFLCLLAAPAFATEIAHVEHGTDSVILRFPLWDVADPKLCATDITDTTTGLEINVSTDVSNGYTDQFRCIGAACVTTDELETITTIGTYATPTAGFARFEIIVAGSCMYELQLPNAIFDTVGATIVNLEITDGNTEIIDHFFTVDLTPVSAATLVDNIWDESTSGHTTAGTFGEQLKTDVDAILLDTGTTLDSAITQIGSDTSAPILAAENADSGNTTTLVDADALSQGDDYWNDWSALLVEFSGGSQIRCVRDFVDSTATLTVSPAYDTSITTEAYRLVAAPACLQTGDTFAAQATAQADLDIITGTTGVNLEAGSITASVVGTAAIDADAIAADAIGASEIAADAIGSDELAATAANEIRDAILAGTIDGTIDLQCAIAMTFAYSAGKWTQSGAVVTYRNPGDTADRLAGTISASSFDTITRTCP